MNVNIVIITALFITVNVGAFQVDHIEKALSELVDSFTEPNEKCLLLNLIYSYNIQEQSHQRLTFDWLDMTLVDFIANESPCSILIFGGNQSEKYSYEESKNNLPICGQIFCTN